MSKFEESVRAWLVDDEVLFWARECKGRDRGPKVVFAVTNRRLIQFAEGDVASVALANVAELHLIEGGLKVAVFHHERHPTWSWLFDRSEVEVAHSLHRLLCRVVFGRPS